MNSFNRWCRTAALTCSLFLGFEGNLFVHNIASQARSMQAPSAVAEKHVLISNQKALAQF